MIDIKELDAGLNKLTGYDYEVLEREERASGNQSVELSMSRSFQARLAAKAGVLNVHDLKALPIREYNQICAATFGFFIHTGADGAAIKKIALSLAHGGWGDISFWLSRPVSELKSWIKLIKEVHVAIKSHR